MTLPTKILLALVIVIGGGTAYAYADVTAKDSDSVNFEPSSSTRGPASIDATDDQSALTVRPEIADNQTEGGSCQITCHPAFSVNQKTALAHFDTDKIK